MAEYSKRPASGSEWRFTGLEFQVLWRQLGLDRLPYPLRYRPVAETQDDLDRQRRDASAALLPRLTEALHRHLVALAEPRERIEVFGFAGRPDTAPVRLHAGIRGDTGTLAIQLPGPDVDTGGDVLIRGVAPTRIPDAIASALPRIPAGSRAPVGSAEPTCTPVRARCSRPQDQSRCATRCAPCWVGPAAAPGRSPRSRASPTTAAPPTTASRCTGSTSTATAATSCGATPMSWSGRGAGRRRGRGPGAARHGAGRGGLIDSGCRGTEPPPPASKETEGCEGVRRGSNGGGSMIHNGGDERQESRQRLREGNTVLRDRVDTMLERLHEQTAALAAAQGAAANLTAEGASADGLVRVTVDASGTVVSTRLDPAAFSRSTPERLADSFSAAAQAASHEVRTRATELMTPVAAMAAEFPDLTDLVPGAPSIRNLVPTVATGFAAATPQDAADADDRHDWRAPILREAHRD
ncbi:hypothetical protein GS498_07345 [Rhodococcus hoagii]|nr:hypothetical protein [Prescottella equi]